MPYFQVMTRVNYHFDKQQSYNEPFKVVLNKLCDWKIFLEKPSHDNNIAHNISNVIT